MFQAFKSALGEVISGVFPSWGLSGVEVSDYRGLGHLPFQNQKAAIGSASAAAPKFQNYIGLFNMHGCLTFIKMFNNFSC
jgi:hypothetical protein